MVLKVIFGPRLRVRSKESKFETCQQISYVFICSMKTLSTSLGLELFLSPSFVTIFYLIHHLYICLLPMLLWSYLCMSLRSTLVHFIFFNPKFNIKQKNIFCPKLKKTIYKKNQFKAQLIKNGPKWTKLERMNLNRPNWTDIN